MNNIPLEYPEFYHDMQLQSQLNETLENNNALRKNNKYLIYGLLALGLAFIGTCIYFDQKKKEDRIRSGFGRF